MHPQNEDPRNFPYTPPPPPPVGFGTHPTPPPPAPRRRVPTPLIVVFVVLAVVTLAGLCGGILEAVGRSAGGSGELRPGRAAVADAATPAPTPSPAASTPSPSPEPTPAPQTREPAADPAAKPVKLTAREWSKVARSPDKYIGRAYIVYGHVTQFDTATGEDSFRANVDGVRRAETWDYDTNTILTNGGTADLSDLVDGDTFRAEVLVAGEFSYESTMGADLAVPHLLVTKIRRY